MILPGDVAGLSNQWVTYWDEDTSQYVEGKLLGFSPQEDDDVLILVGQRKVSVPMDIVSAGRLEEIDSSVMADTMDEEFGGSTYTEPALDEEFDEDDDIEL